ncbi:MAG: aldo/keto reductase [Pirellulaceae bacterium]
MYRSFGSTDIQISRIAFGCGPLAEMMTETKRSQQREIVAAAIDAGINWFDTARTYGNGASEENLGGTLRDLKALDRVHLASKVRLMPNESEDIAFYTRKSVETSLKVLGVDSLTLLQIHNAITQRRGDVATSLTVEDVLGPEGMLETLRELQQEGKVHHLGLTGTGDPKSLKAVIDSGAFESIQVPYSLANPSAAFYVSDDFVEFDHGQILNYARKKKLFTFAIRVFAGGALLNRAPSTYTYKTQFFPLELYKRDVQRAARVTEIVAESDHALEMPQTAIRAVLSTPALDSAIIGFGDPSHIENAVHACNAEPLDTHFLERLMSV